MVHCGPLSPLFRPQLAPRCPARFQYNEIVADPSIADDDYEAPRMGVRRIGGGTGAACRRRWLGACSAALQPGHDLQDCELMYIAFDVLHNGTEAVIHKPLRERQHILAQLVVEQPAGAPGRVCAQGIARCITCAQSSVSPSHCNPPWHRCRSAE